MKRIILFVALTTLFAGTIASCGKSTKGKMDGEWNVDSYKATSTSASGSNSSSSILTIEGTSITYISTTNSVTTTENGTVDIAEWNINKDGTWDRELAFTIISNGVTRKTVLVSSGNWAFQSKIGEYKKNERVAFSVLSESTTVTSTIGSSSIIESESATYLDGENNEVFVITESKKKELAMELKKSSTYSNGSVSSETGEGIIKLSLK